jgi:hypothetical protein
MGFSAFKSFLPERGFTFCHDKNSLSAYILKLVLVSLTVLQSAHDKLVNLVGFKFIAFRATHR